MNNYWRLICLLGACAVAGWCQSPILELQLTAPLTSYDSEVGDAFRAILTAPVESQGRVVLPSGTIVHGTVARVVRVGVGLIHERATLELEFTEYELADHRRFPLTARLRSIHNARESVTPTGQIRGVLAASNPQSLVSGIWHRPTPDLFGHSLLGLTGASGRLWTEYSMGPYGAIALFAVRSALFRLPEPEIQLPAGTEMRALLTSIAPDAPTFSKDAPVEVPEDIAEWVQTQPFAISKPNAQPVDDIVNVVFTGSRRQLVNAFAAAGWSQPDPLNGRSRTQMYKAYTAEAGYAAAPVSKLFYRDNEPDLVFQKSLNTIAKRDHIRIWRTEHDGQTMWLAAATQDIGIAWNSHSLMFTHEIQPRVDWERQKIGRDLTFAGCVAAVGYVDRDAAVRRRGVKKGIVTDGRVAVVSLQDCDGERQFSDPALITKAPGSMLLKSVRRTILELRQYVLRGNVYYWAYRGLRYHHDSEKALALFWQDDEKPNIFDVGPKTREVELLAEAIPEILP